MRRGWCRGLEGDSQGSHSCSKLAALIRPRQRDAFHLAIDARNRLRAARHRRRGADRAARAEALRSRPDRPARAVRRSGLRRVPRSRRCRRQEPRLCRSRGAGPGARLLLGPRLRPRPRSAQAVGRQFRRRGRARAPQRRRLGHGSRCWPPSRRSSRSNSRPGVVCAPARPVYDSVELSSLLDKTYTGQADWAYPRADETAVRARAASRRARGRQARLAVCPPVGVEDRRPAQSDGPTTQPVGARGRSPTAGPATPRPAA